VSIDPITRFGTRESLIAALVEAVEPESPPALLAVFDLEGLDEYQALFGSLAANALLSRLAGRLFEVIGPAGSCFRPRAYEFAVLVPSPISEVAAVLDAAASALRERAAPVSVAAAWGAAMVPEEATDAMDALILADERLASNAPRRRSRRRRATDTPPDPGA